MNDETAQLISVYIISEIQKDRSTNALVQQIRCGNAKYITQEAWEVVALYLEGAYAPLDNRTPEDNWCRDQWIIEEYKKLEGTMPSDNQICKVIEDRMMKRWGRKKTLDGIRPIGDSMIKKIVNKFKKEREHWEDV